MNAHAARRVYTQKVFDLLPGPLDQTWEQLARILFDTVAGRQS